jgi:hypothetical protein
MRDRSGGPTLFRRWIVADEFSSFGWRVRRRLMVDLRERHPSLCITLKQGEKLRSQSISSMCNQRVKRKHWQHG